MNIIIPLGGKGERFAKNGYTKPKPLISILDKCMIDHVLDNLNVHEDDKIFIFYNSKLDDYDFSKYISNKYSHINLINICDTKGAAETLYLGIGYILNNYTYNKKCLVLDCDTFYTEDIRNIFYNSIDNIVFYTKNDNENAIYSYIKLNDKSFIIDIKEKEKISDNANTGAYAFTDINSLYNYCKYVIENNITFNKEPYTSCVISEMLKSNINFKGWELKNEYVFSLGTPDAVEKYINNVYAFLFDLDGTLVITDEIYFDVWYKILIKYNIILTKEIFKDFIQGNNDSHVLRTLLTNIRDLPLSKLSKIKDELFIENINKIKVIDGLYDIINKIKKLGYKLCIVTNCNKNVARAIVKHINIEKSVDFIISSDDCLNGKPDSEPYRKAIQQYNILNHQCFIFEDSKTGILSGSSVNPKLLIGIETIYDKNELMNFGANLTIKNFAGLNVSDLINSYISKVIYLKTVIKKNMTIDNILDVIIDENKLKGGFIADVISYKIITKDNIHSYILKYENILENNLSSMAKKIQLYEREYYFYTSIYKDINVNIPKFYGLVEDENYNKIGIILENLIERNFKINLNLNLENIDTTLKIIDRMAKMHSKFWGKNLKKMFPNLKNTMDEIFFPFFSNFITERYTLFKTNWFKNLNIDQQNMLNEIYENFSDIQKSFSLGNNLTFIHGDIKSPNIFYDTENSNEPWFIDWQHCAIGKGVQDLIFFIIESFQITNIKHIFSLAKQYYYIKLLEYGVTNYSYEEYERDIYTAICYIPFFTSVWFGTINQDELIDKNFPYFFINKMLYLLEFVKNTI